MSAVPSGEQFEISHGDLRAVVVEVGGGLRTLTHGSWDVLDGYHDDRMCDGGRGQILMPWPNRLDHGRYTFQGEAQQLALTEPDNGNAIHGLVRWASWRAESRTADRLTMSYRLHPSPGYPFTLDLSATYAIGERYLEVTLGATNAGDRACPFGAGQHPYFSVGTPHVDDAELCIPARTIHRYNERLIPVERVPVEGTELDFREPRRIGGTVINMDYTDFERDADGLFTVTLSRPGGPSLRIWMDGAFQHATVYTGETLKPERRRQGLAVEPMTCPPNAFVSGDDLTVLQPGESWTGRWGVTVDETGG